MNDIITLYTSYMVEEKLRTNRFKMKKFDDGDAVVNISKGHSRETGVKVGVRMIIRKADLLKLKAWLNARYPDQLQEG